MVIPFLLVLFYYVFILVVSSIPSDMIYNPWGNVPHIDKIYHMMEYGFFGMLLARLVYWLHGQVAGRWNWLLDFYLLAIFFSLLDELWQSFTPGRMVDVYDLITDVIGATGGAWIYLCLVWYVLKKDVRDSLKPDFQFRERMVFACVLIVICAFVFGVLNLLRYKEIFFHAESHLSLAISLVEALCLITVILRFYWLFKKNQKNISALPAARP